MLETFQKVFWLALAVAMIGSSLEGCAQFREKYMQPSRAAHGPAQAATEDPTSASSPASQVTPSFVGTWQFENALGDDEQMSIFADGRVMFFYLNGHIDDVAMTNGEVRQPEFGPDAMMRFIPGDSSTIVGHIGLYDTSAKARLSGRAKVWRKIDDEPKDQKIIIDQGQPLELTKAPPSPDDTGPLKVPPGMVGTWRLLENPFRSKAQISIFRDGRTILFQQGKSPINYIYVAGEIRSDTGAARLMLFDNITLIVLDYDQTRKISGYASVWRRASTEPQADKMLPE